MADDNRDRPAVMFDADVCRELRISIRTLKRLRRARAFPIPELPSLDKRHRYARRDVDAYIAREPARDRRKAATPKHAVVAQSGRAPHS